MANSFPNRPRRANDEREALAELNKRKKGSETERDEAGKLTRQPGEKTWSQKRGLPSRFQAGQYQIDFFQEGSPTTIIVQIGETQQIEFITDPSRFNGQIITNLLYYLENFYGKFKIRPTNQFVTGLPDLKT